MDQGAECIAGELRLTVPNRPPSLTAVGDLVADAARIAGWDAVQAGYPAAVATRLAAGLMDPQLDPPEDGCVEIVVRPVETAVHITVHDDGPPFDPVQGGRAEQFAHGLLSAASADWIAFTNLGSGGREFAALLHRPGAAADDGRAEDAPAPPEDGHSLVVRASEPMGTWAGRVPAEFAAAARRAESTEPASTVLRIGLLQPADAASVSRCIFDAYRLTYFDEMMYRPAQLVHLNASGEMVSAVAIAPDGTIAGHVALEFAPGEPAIADVAAAVTHRAWRGHGIAERLFAFLIEEAERRRMTALWCDAVTVHPFTQRLAHGLGFEPCGFHLGFEPPSTRFFGINDRPAHRGSSVVMARAIGPLPDAPLDVPQRHRDFVAAAFARLGAPGRLDRPAPAGETAAETRLRTMLHEGLGVGRLTLVSPGADVRERLHEGLHDALGRGAEVVEARVNLQASGSSDACDELEDLGFIVTGVLPGGPDADWLLLQYHRGIVVDYDGMVVDAEESRELLALVRAGDAGAI